MRALLVTIAFCVACIPCDAKPKPELVRAVELPREILTGENLATAADLRRVVEAIKIAPRGARFSSQQLKGMEDVLTALLKVAAAEKIDSIRFSASCDLFATLEATIGAKSSWQKLRSEAQGEEQSVDLASVVASIKADG